MCEWCPLAIKVVQWPFLMGIIVTVISTIVMVMFTIVMIMATACQIMLAYL